LAKCREWFWRQFGKVPEIFLEADLWNAVDSYSGIFQKMPPKLIPSSFCKVPAVIGKCLQIQINAVKFIKFLNISQNLESQQILESQFKF
jgi:hypothetical protein